MNRRRRFIGPFRPCAVSTSLEPFRLHHLHHLMHPMNRSASPHGCLPTSCEISVHVIDLEITNGLFRVGTIRRFANRIIDVIPERMECGRVIRNSLLQYMPAQPIYITKFHDCSWNSVTFSYLLPLANSQANMLRTNSISTVNNMLFCSTESHQLDLSSTIYLLQRSRAELSAYKRSILPPPECQKDVKLVTRMA